MTPPMATLDDESDLDVPEEPGSDEEENESTITEVVAREKNATEGDNLSQTSSVMSFLTAVRIARWMARAYGYVAKKKKAYLSQDLSASRQLSRTDLLEGNRSRRPSVTDDSGPKVSRDPMALELVGEEIQDQKTVCKWFATSYGETNREYHEAYSREILRQMREQIKGDEDGALNLKKKQSWF